MKVISAGLPRSGSTLLFNILRELLKDAYRDRLISFWCKSPPESIPSDAVLLIKTHRLVREYRKASKIFFTYRDIRDIAVSAYRMFDYPICMRTIRSYVREYCVAKQVGAHRIEYEYFITNPVSVTEGMGMAMGIDTNFVALYSRVFEEMKSGKRETLVHPNYATNTQYGEWRTIIPLKLQQEIVDEFGWWFKELGYPL